MMRQDPDPDFEPLFSSTIPKEKMSSFSRFTFLFVAWLVSRMGSNVSSLSEDNETYPLTDDDGYYLAFKNPAGSKWVNWWARNRPGTLEVGSGFASSPDQVSGTGIIHSHEFSRQRVTVRN